MYKVTIFNDGKETTIHSHLSNEIKLETGTIKKEINKIDSFNIGFYMNNPAYNKLKPFTTLIKVLNTKTNKYEFEGRVLAPDEDVDNEGLYDAAYECEGELAYLHDSQQRHLEYRGKPKNLLNTLLNYHNDQVEDYKKFEIGHFEVTTSTDNIYIYLSAEKTTFEEIEDKILDRVGGELQIRKENGVRYLDVLERLGENKSNEIRIAKNLISSGRMTDPTEIITRFTPLGERIESEDEEATDASEARLTIESVNNGLPYIDDEALIDEFGIQGGSKTWDDITRADRLLSTGQKWLRDQKVVHTKYEITALDLFLIGLDIHDFSIGNSHPVKNPVMNIDERLRIIGKTTDINSPQDASLKIGDKFKSLEEYQVDSKRVELKVVDLENTVGRLSSKYNQSRQELENAKTQLIEVQNTLEHINAGEIPEELANLHRLLNEVKDSINNIEIPEYGLVTPSNDGLMSRYDKVKLDSLSDTNYDSEINEINIKINNLIDRVEALEE